MWLKEVDRVTLLRDRNTEPEWAYNQKQSILFKLAGKYMCY